MRHENLSRGVEEQARETPFREPLIVGAIYMLLIALTLFLIWIGAM